MRNKRKRYEFGFYGGEQERLCLLDVQAFLSEQKGKHVSQAATLRYVICVFHRDVLPNLRRETAPED